MVKSSTSLGLEMWSMTNSFHFSCGTQTGRVTEIMAVFVLVVILAATFTTSECAATDTKPPPAAASKPPTDAAAEFLRARCDTAVQSFGNYCYNSLLPHADSFHGSNVELARTATATLVTWLQASLSEMRHANSTGPHVVLGMRNGCIELIEQATDGDRLALASLSRLAAAGSGGKRSERDLQDANKWIQKATRNINRCKMDIGDDTPPLPVTNTHLTQSLFVAVDLVKGIAL